MSGRPILVRGAAERIAAARRLVEEHLARGRYGSAVLGDVRQHVRLLDSPAQCESPSCPCPDMWQMLD